MPFFVTYTMNDELLTKVDVDEEETDASTQKTSKIMHKVVTDAGDAPQAGDIVEGTVLAIDKNVVYVEIPPASTGIIYGREFMNAREIIKNLGIGDSITATVVDTDPEDGHLELSLKEARQALIWSDAEHAVKEKKLFCLPIKEANKGGLIIEWQGISGFLPASQLSEKNYPRVENGDKDKILEELQRLVGKSLDVIMIAVDPKEGKLIFSEKGPEEKDKEILVSKYAVGDEVDGEVTGIVDFGIFIKVENGLEGLAHISELDWGLVENPRHMFNVGQKVRAKVIEVKDGKVSLSIKALKQNPWADAANKYAKDDIVKAVIIKYNKHGALASIEEGVAGLVHVSEFESMDKLREALELGKTYTFKINVFEPKDQRMTLSFKFEK